MREGVAVRPSQNEKILGRLSLIKQHRVVFLAWLPYSNGSLKEDGTFVMPLDNQRVSSQHARGRALQKAHKFTVPDIRFPWL